MGSMVNALEIPEILNQAQSISTLERLPYTMFPNIWLDEIRYKLNRGVCAIVECVLRQTLGYHRDTAKITTQEFANYAGVGLTVAKEAKKEAIEIGIVVLIERGTGGNTSEYGINLDYTQADPEDQPNIQTERERIPKPQTPKKPKIVPLEIIEPRPLENPELPKKPESKEQKSSKNQGKVNRSQSDDSLKGSKKDPDLDKKTNKNVPDDSEKFEDSEERKKMENVCSLLRNLGFEITDKALVFLKRMISKFGLEKILEKIRIMKSQIARNIVIRSFQAWLTSAVKNDYQPYDADAKKIEADAAREREIEKGRLAFRKRETDRQKLVDAEQNDPEMKNRLNEIFAAAGLSQFEI